MSKNPQLVAHITFIEGQWMVSFSHRGAEVNRFTHAEIRDIAQLWKWLASMTARQPPDKKWTQKPQAIELHDNGSWYHGGEGIA